MRAGEHKGRGAVSNRAGRFESLSVEPVDDGWGVLDEPLPPLVQQAYTLLGAEWRNTADDWRAAGHSSPPVMLTVCNLTSTAARVERFFTSGDMHWPELRDANRTLRVDSRVLEKAEIGEKAGADKDNYGDTSLCLGTRGLAFAIDCNHQAPGDTGCANFGSSSPTLRIVR